MSGKKKFIRNLYYSSLGIYVQQFISLATGIVLARSMSPDRYGVYSLLMWIASLSVMLINGGVTSSLTKFISESCEKKNKPLELAIINYLKKIQLASGSFVVLILTAFFIIFGEHVIASEAKVLLYVVVAAAVFRALFFFYIAVAEGREEFDKIAFIYLVVSPVTFVSVVVGWGLGFELHGFIVLYLISSCIYFFVIWSALRKGLRDIEKTEMSGVLRKRINSHVKVVKVNVVLAFFVTKQLELIFLNYFSSSQDIAYFNIAFSLSSSAVGLVPGVVLSLLMPIMSRTILSNDLNYISNKLLRMTKLLVFMAIPVAIAISVFAEDIIVLLYGVEYEEAIFPLQILVWTVALMTICSATISYQFSSDRQGFVLRATIIALIVNIIVDAYFIANYQLVGAVIGYSFSGVFFSYLLFREAMNDLKIKFELGLYAKLFISGVVAAIPIIILKSYVTFLLLLVPSVLFFLASYVLLSTYMQCWDRDDIIFVYKSLENKPIGKITVVRKVIVWMINVSK